MRLLRPRIERWFLGKFEDRMRAAAGMPSRKEEKRRRKAAEASYGSKKTGKWGRNGKSPGKPRHTGPIIPKEYAEDVEFTEVKIFEQTEITGTVTDKTGKKVGEWHESQIEDAEFVEIKTKS